MTEGRERAGSMTPTAAAAAVAAAAAHAAASSAIDDDDEIECVGEKTWAERDKELRAQAVLLD